MSTSTTSTFDRRAVSRDLFSATIGSVCCCYVGQPFDTVKVRMQTRPNEYSRVGATVLSIFRNEGIAAFWKGAIPTACGMAAENCMAFGVNAALKRAFPEERPHIQHDNQSSTNSMPSLGRPFVMGALTGCCSALAVISSEIVKAKLQVVVGRSDVTATSIMRQMIARQGYLSFLTGLDAQLCRDVSFYAVFFGGYELNCYLFRTYVPSMPDELNYFLSGGLAGMMGWTLAMPFDVPKTNVQASYETKVIGSYFPELRRIVQERGIGGLYSGLGPTLVRAFPANAALFLGVELGKRAFDDLIG